MRIRCLAAAGLMPAAGAGAGPVGAATSGSATTTFVISGGTFLTIVPVGPVSLGAAAPGGTITVQLGAVQVSDLRALPAAARTASVTSTNFTTGGGTPAETVANTGVSYWSGAATAATGTATFSLRQAAAADAQALGTSQTALAATAGVGDSSATWSPALVATPPAQALAGTYSATVTHSVA
jgi:hypothetical protein